MEKKGIKKLKNIVITGPESSGKTTLFEQLKCLSGFHFIPEYSRKYIQNINRSYNYNDILKIAKFHVLSYKAFSKKGLPVILDTDLLTLLIWCEYKYKKCHPFIIDQLINNPPDLYLICSTKIPWEFDPQRENPNNRTELFNIHLKKIRELGVEFKIMEGNKLDRFSQAKKILQNVIL
ncbi:MAG: hypothetical protein CL832_09930 [Crocinitomicaceae bacterium]|nr:hypothetical protein [Crocinitomicaceae bacterium]|tara:strand:+ start:298 stop:831 length:534 start_codon:yes stop_codon:yes gene_type:complete